jgi:hypothetical protein
LVGRGRREDFFKNKISVPKVFPSGSQNVPQVPNVFPRRFPISPHFYPILFGCHSTSMYISCKEERWRGRAKGCIFKLLC